jgi:hypothetical protein
MGRSIVALFVGALHRRRSSGKIDLLGEIEIQETDLVAYAMQRSSNRFGKS